MMEEKYKVFEKEISYINDLKHKESIKILINLLPDYFFSIPASSTGKYHPDFASGEGGLVRHTKVAVNMAKTLFDNNSIFTFSNHDKDLIVMALIMHDGLKEGLVKEKYTRFDHPLLASKFIKDNNDKAKLSEEDLKLITSMIESHMGEWNTNSYSNVVLPLPITKHQKFVHMCDYLASRKFINVKFENNNIID